MKYIHPRKYIRHILLTLRFLYLSFIYNRKLKALHVIYGKDPVRVGFIGAALPSCDVFTGLYKKFDSDNKFNCTFVVLPYTHDSKEDMIRMQEDSRQYLSNLGIVPILGYNQDKDCFEDLKGHFDVVFLEKEYDWVPNVFKACNFFDALSFHISYGPYNADNIMGHMYPKVMSEVYKILQTSSMDYSMLKKHSPINGKNILKTYLGYPKIDKFFFEAETAVDVWEKAKQTQKRIIWAPHHTWAEYSNFEHYNNFFLDYVKKNADSVCMAFKPHPALRASLKFINGWSDTEIDNYYNEWKEGENTCLFEGEWFDLFLTSDAMIMDSISFMTEYSLTTKPSCVLYRTGNDGERVMKFSDCGEKVYDVLYHAKNEDEVNMFLDMIKRGDDPKYVERVQLMNKMYFPPNKVSAVENIYNYINDILKF